MRQPSPRSGWSARAGASAASTSTRLATIGLLGVGLLLVVTWTVVSALTVCLNESPRFAQVARAAEPGLADLAGWLLARLGLVAGDGSCEPSTLARLLGLAGPGYLAGLLLLDTERVPRRLAWGVVLGAALACQTALFATPALLSTDILDYASYGRVAAIHGMNPYVVPPETFTTDPFWGYGAWQHVVTVYGPLWTSIDAAIARVLPAGDPVQLALAYKGLAFLIQLGNLALLGWLLRRWLPRPEERVTALALFAWNPLVLLELVGNGHNDALMALLVLLAVAALTRATSMREHQSVREGQSAGEARDDDPGQDVAGPTSPVGKTAFVRSGGTSAVQTGWRSSWPWLVALVCLELGALVKFVPLGVAAAVGLVWLRRLPTWRARLGQGLLAGGLLVGLALLVSWPWLSSADVLQPLLGVASGGQRFKDGWQDAPAAWIAVRILPPLGVPAEPATVRESVSRAVAWGISRAVFLVYLALEARWLWRQSRREARQAVRAIVAAAARGLLLAVLLFVTQVYPWYFLWPLPLATLLGWRSAVSKAVVAFGLAFLPAYYLREFASYGVFYLPLYLLGALVVLGVAWAGGRRPRGDRSASPSPSPQMAGLT